MKKDLNEIAKLEQAIEKKYGTAATINPKGSWDEEKERKYLENLKNQKKNPKEKVTEDQKGFIIRENKFKKPTTDRDCPVCGKYSFLSKDDIYMLKFRCCFDCYIQYVEGREERWNSGWRPKN